MLQDTDALKVRISRMMSDLEAWRFEMHKAQVVPWYQRSATDPFWREAERSRVARIRKVRSPSHEQVFSVLDELCDYYLTAKPGERRTIRELFDHDAVWCLLDYAMSTGDHIASCDDTRWVQRGLAALSIADNRPDFRDVFVRLGELYIVSARAGIDPRPFLQEVGCISSPTPSVQPWAEGKWSVWDQFTKFEETKFFEVDVKPHLPK
jgi:hypothetical protein